MKSFLRSVVVLAVICVSTVAGAAPFDDCQDHLPFGVPRLTKNTATTPVCHVGYALLHDDKFLVPRWVAYRLTGPHTLGCIDRPDNFHADDKLPDGKRAEPSDYAKSGFDQGHQAPAQDFAWNMERMRDSFSMANMAPQLPGLNRQGWERLEETVRVWATDRKELIVYVGPILLNTKRTIGDNHVIVPSAFWKVIVDPANGDALAFIMPQHAIAKGTLTPWQVSIEQVETSAGITLPLPPNVNRTVEAPLWPADLKAWSAHHKKLCPTPPKKKKIAVKKKTPRKKSR
jgi:endonuclease G